MDPNKRECLYLGPALILLDRMNAYSYKREIKVIITRNVTRAHVVLGAFQLHSQNPRWKGRIVRVGMIER